MNDFYSCSSVVLAHGGDVDCIGGILLLSVMSIVVWGSLIWKKKWLFVSSLIPYVLVSVFILQVPFGVKIPDSIVSFCLDMAFYPCLRIPLILGINSGLFLGIFIVDTLIIFGIIKLILFIKDKVSSKKSAAVQ